MRSLVAADFFAGAGGLSLGFGQAGFRIAFANELCREYADTYEQNHPGTRMFRADIRALSAKDIAGATGLAKNELDVLIGGPPCQGFSINAPTRNKEDDRNQLFRHYGRLVLEGLRPKVIVMENVPGMLSLDKGRFIDAIYRLFESAGYKILFAAHYGVGRTLATLLHRNDLEAKTFLFEPRTTRSARELHRQRNACHSRRDQ